MSRLKEVVSDLMALAQNDQLADTGHPPPWTWIEQGHTAFAHPKPSESRIYFHTDEVRVVRKIIAMGEGCGTSGTADMIRSIADRNGLNVGEFDRVLYNQLNQVWNPVAPTIQPLSPWMPDTLPPVGTKCDFQIRNGNDESKWDWTPVTVAAEHHEGGVFVSIEGSWYLIDSAYFITGLEDL